jgi:hypothetical protein
MAEAHVGDGDYEAAKVLAYVYLEEPVCAPYLLVRRAMEQLCGAPAFSLAASSRGVGVMVFHSHEERERLVAQSPFHFEGNHIVVERYEEADNMFFAFYSIYAEIAAEDFPLEHWKEGYAREALSAIEKLLIRNHSGPASIAKIRVIRTWLDNNHMPDFDTYILGLEPALHTPPAYHPVGNPPTQMPAAPENLVASMLE